MGSVGLVSKEAFQTSGKPERLWTKVGRELALLLRVTTAWRLNLGLTVGQLGLRREEVQVSGP